MIAISKQLLTLSVFALLAMTPDVAEAQNCDRNPTHPKCAGDGGGGGGGGSLPEGGDYIVLDNPDAETEYLGGPLKIAGDDNNSYSYGEDTLASSSPPSSPLSITYSWMHGDVGIAFSHDLDGTGSNLIIVDRHEGDVFAPRFDANMKDTNLSGTAQLHGYWTSLQASLVAPGAGDPTDVHWDSTDQSRNRDGTLIHDTTEDITSSYKAGLNVVNLSFGLFENVSTDTAASGYTIGTRLWDSLVVEAHSGNAVFVKAAGNTNGGTVDGTVTLRVPKPTKHVDVLNTLLVDAPGAIFVGALDGNGPNSTIASYSTIAGDNTAIQDMFLVVGVDSDILGIEGTSFAAPIVSGYAAIIGQKFQKDGKVAAASAVVDQLLFTARTDTIADFDASCTMRSQVVDSTACTRSSVYGVGEADLSRAISPSRPPT